MASMQQEPWVVLQQVPLVLQVSCLLELRLAWEEQRLPVLLVLPLL